MNPKLLFTSIFLYMALFSCGKDEAVYSCNPEIDKWVVMNKEAISKVTGAELTDISGIEYQKAVFRAFTPAQRKAVWVSKLDNVLLLGWNDREKEHILTLRSLLDKYEGLFDDGFPQQKKDELAVEAYRWGEYAKDTLHWNDRILYAIAGNPNKMLTKAGELKMTNANPPILKTGQETGGDKKDCECNSVVQDHESIINDCGSDGCFFSKECKPTSWGCSLFWGTNCDGQCY